MNAPTKASNVNVLDLYPITRSVEAHRQETLSEQRASAYSMLDMDGDAQHDGAHR